MNKKKTRTTVAERRSLLASSSSLLDHHIEEILEAVEDIHNLAGMLRVIAFEEEKRDLYEGRLYAALTHLDHHVKPAIKEWDRVLDRMPEE